MLSLHAQMHYTLTYTDSYLHHMAHAYIPLRCYGDAYRASMRTVYRYFYGWAVRNRRPFTMEEFPQLLREATGLDVSEIYQKWQAASGDR